MFEIDGITFNAEWEYGSYQQTAEILNGENAGRLQNSASMFLDPKGTFFNSKGVLLKRDCTDKEWDDLFRVLANPLGEHEIVIPFDQGYMRTKIYISSATRTLMKKNKTKLFWSHKYEVSFVAMDSQWLAGGDLQGYTEGVI